MTRIIWHSIKEKVNFPLLVFCQLVRSTTEKPCTVPSPIDAFAFPLLCLCIIVDLASRQPRYQVLRSGHGAP
jgi:hypothetical protein